MRCPHCSVENPIHQRYCVSCGGKIDVEFKAIADSVRTDAAKVEAGRRGRFLVPLAAGVVLLNLVAWIVWWVGADVRTGPLTESFPVPAALPPEVPIASVGASELPPIPGAPDSFALPLPGRSARIAERFGFRRSPVKEALHAARGGDPKALLAVRRGLECLVRRQVRSKGSWRVKGEWERGRRAWGEAGVTGLAVLALLADGHVWTDAKDPWGESAGRGVRFLVASQDESGRIGPNKGNYMYNHGIATAALCEAYVMSGLEPLRGPAERALKYLISGQRPNGGWDYTTRRGTRADISVTAWQAAALYSARMAGLEIPGKVPAAAVAFIEALTNPGTAETGYQSRPNPKRKITHPTLGPTAMSLASRQALGQPPSAGMCQRQADILVRPNNLPEWRPEWTKARAPREFHTYYYWYHGTMGLRMVGGKPWQDWNQAVTKTLLGSQQKDGSWRIVGHWACEGGRAYVTALAVLTLEATYRYP